MKQNEFNNILNCDPRTCLSSKIRRINKLTANIFRKYLNPFGVTDSQLTLLFILSKNDGFKQSELSLFTQSEKSTTNRNLKRLIENEWIEDKEFPIYKITTKGMQLVDDIVPEWEKAMKEMNELIGLEGVDSVNNILSNLSGN